MTRSTVVVTDRVWTVAGLEPRARGELFQAIVVAQLVDDSSGAPLTGPVRISSTSAGLDERVAGSGFVGLAGVPIRVFPQLATSGYALEVLIEAGGYETRHEQVAVATQPGFPGTFVNAELGVLRMRRIPTVVRVGTYDLDAANRPQPLGAVSARISGWWPSLDQLGNAAAVTPLLGIGPGLSVRRPVGTALDVPAFGTPAEPPRHLVGGAAPGATTLAVTHTSGLTAGDLVGLDLPDTERAEHVEVTAIDGPADLLSPASVSLRFPLRTGHADGSAVVRLVVPGPAVAVATTTAEALAGDRTLQVSTLTGLAAGQVVRITSAAAPAEYRTTDDYELITDTDGVGRLAPLSGVAAVVVVATAGALSASARLTVTPPSVATDLTLT